MLSVAGFHGYFVGSFYESSLGTVSVLSSGVIYQFIIDVVGTAVAQWLRCCATVGTAVAQWLRCCATNRKVADSIPAGVI